MMPVILSNSVVTIVFFGIISFLFLSWGSFLNVVAYRLLHNVPFFGARSTCPSCKKTIAWYDLIPVLSWFFLNGKCRWCKKSISYLYTVIELITLFSFWGIILMTQPQFWFGYGILFSALIVTIRTDVESMIILRPFSLGIIPVGFLLSSFNYVSISLGTSITGVLIGFLMLFAVRYLSLLITGQYGMGNGDPELLAAIGAFAGPFGCWTSLMIGSFCGSILGLFFFWRYGSTARKIPIPFGPFLALGAILTIIFNTQIIQIFALL